MGRRKLQKQKLLQMDLNSKEGQTLLCSLGECASLISEIYQLLFG